MKEPRNLLYRGWCQKILFCICRSGRIALLDRYRIRGRSHRAGDGQRRRGEEEVVHAVLVAVVRKILDVKNLADADTAHRHYDPMPGLAGDCGLIGPTFAPARVRTHRLEPV